MASLPLGKQHWIIALSGILLVMGGMLGVQIHTQVVNRDLLYSRRSSAVYEIFNSYQEKSTEQKKEITKLRTQLAKYENEATGGSGLSKLIHEQLTEARIGLGLVPVKGPGLTLTLEDSDYQLGKDADIDKDVLDALYILHVGDLIDVVNELWNNGAEAISLNGQRIVAGSGIVCSGSLVQVNHESIPSPFVFTVIGNPKTLMSGLSIRGGLLDEYRKSYGFKITLTEQKALMVPAVAISQKYKYATPVLQDAATEQAKGEEPIP